LEPGAQLRPRPEEPANNQFFDEVMLGKAGEVLPGLVKELRREGRKARV
jgi:hypothetical protein